MFGMKDPDSRHDEETIVSRSVNLDEWEGSFSKETGLAIEALLTEAGIDGEKAKAMLKSISEIIFTNFPKTLDLKQKVFLSLLDDF
jgi:hypothetical protein